MVRLLFLVHRYLGIAIGLVMLLWTLSGVVMMYREYPELDEQERLALLPLLQLQDCCVLPQSEMLQGQTYRAANLAMLETTPVLRLLTMGRGWIHVNLRDGSTVQRLDREQANRLGAQFAARLPQPGTAELRGEINNDQWTVYSSYNPHRPLFKYRLDDLQKTEFYISSQSGEVVQLTTAEQRLWGYLGAVIHWLYPTQLRQHTALWAQLVIWLTIIGIFLTVIGIYIGLRQYRRRRSGRWSPYRGFAFFHHYAGLVFGLLTLSWVFSGLFSMNPWGALEGEGAGPEINRLAGRQLEWQEIEQWVDAARQMSLLGVRRLDLFVQGEQPVAIAHDVTGAQRRLEAANLQPDTLSEAQLYSLAQRLQPETGVAETAVLDSGDAYYYSHHELREFPVYRVILDEPQMRRYYLSRVSGQLLYKSDPELRWYRWLFYGLHRGDFTVTLRSRPLWDILMLFFLAGVTLVCGTGCVMGYRRLTRSTKTLSDNVLNGEVY